MNGNIIAFYINKQYYMQILVFGANIINLYAKKASQKCDALRLSVIYIFLFYKTIVGERIARQNFNRFCHFKSGSAMRSPTVLNTEIL